MSFWYFQTFTKLFSKIIFFSKLFGNSINKHIFASLNQTNMQNKQTRPLYVIASEIRNDWKKVYFGAQPYLDAMSNLDNVNQNYLFDTGKSIVLYFLGNANTWKGETAKRIKKELKDMCGIK